MAKLGDLTKTLSDALGVKKYVAISFGLGVSAVATAFVSYSAGLFNLTAPAIIFHITFFFLAVVLLALFATLHYATNLRKSAPDAAGEIELRRQAIAAQRAHTEELRLTREARGECAKLAIRDVAQYPGFLGPAVIGISFSISNPGPPTTFHGWEIEIQLSTGNVYKRKMDGTLGLDAEGDLQLKPLEQGGRRSTTWEFCDLRENSWSTFLKPGTRYTMRTFDIQEREISATFVLPKA